MHEMAQSGGITELANQSLDLVGRELASTLDSARAEIEDYVDGQSDAEALVRAASMLHLAAGALKIVEIHGAALLAEEMEEVCRVLTASGDTELKERGLGALTRAMVQLPAYLDRMLAGNGDVALVLLPLVNDLREIRGKPLMSEGTLLLLNSGPRERAGGQPETPAADGDFGPGLARLAQTLRPRFQAALLGWIRGAEPERSLARLVEICDRLIEAAGSDAGREFWSVVGGVLAALGAGGLDASVALKRLVGQVDRQLKRLIDGGEDAFARQPPGELLNSLLYYVARAKTDLPRVRSLREQFRLAEMVPDEAQIERARENLSGPSVKLMQTVALAISEDLATVKDSLDIFVRTGMADGSSLSPQVDLLRKIGDTLGVLGLDGAQAQIHREAQALDAAIADSDFESSGVLERVAAALLDVEDTLGRELVRIAAPAPGAEVPDAEAGDDDSTHYRHVTQAVMNECIVNLAKVKDAIVRIVEEPDGVRVLDQIQPQLRGITAGLLMLNKTRAVRVVERIGQVIATRLARDGQVLKQSHLERLADAIVSVEYYMETLSIGRGDPWYMLDNAQRCLDLLERLPGAEAEPAAEATPEAASSPMESRPAPAEEPGKRLSVMEVDEERSEPELVEIFIEEAKEEIANIEKLLPQWLENRAQTDALIAVRRSFHTLKGSGRMIGARLIGEFAWSVENLLNRVINQTLPASQQLADIVAEASGALPQLVEQLEIGTSPTADIGQLMSRARALAEGEAEAGAEADAAAASTPAPIDPVLIGIFAREIRTHLQTLRDYVAAPDEIDDTVYRASHTLLGSARMANVPGAIALAAPLEKLLGGLQQQEATPEAGDVVAIAAAADEFERLAGALDDGATFEPGESVLAALDRAVAANAARAPEASAGDSDIAHVAESAGYDPDIAQIFAEEAAELLEQAESAVQDLRPGGDAAAGLREMQRLLHTIKGGARMAGIMTMGDLSHALESLLAAMADRLVALTDDALGLIRESLDQLQQMRDAVDAGQPVAAAPLLVDAIEQCARRGGEVPAAPAAGTAVDEAEPAAPARPPVSAPASPGPEGDAGRPPDHAAGDGTVAQPGSAGQAGADEDLGAAEVAGHVPGEEPAPVVAPAADGGTEAPFGLMLEGAGPPAPATPPDAGVPGPEFGESEAAAQPQAQADVEADAEAGAAGPAAAAVPEAPPATIPQRQAEKADTTRVNADLLDELLNQAGEISIFQSRLAQQMHSIDFHLGELGQTVTRLREQLRSLESETEAQILFRHQDDESGETGFDPLELDRYSTIQQLSRALAETSNDVASINELLSGLTSETETLLTQQSRVTSELQDGLMHTRMVPMNRQVPRLQRIVRQAAADTGKRAELIVEGATSQLDRQVLDSILPALEHILRNAVAHGIEAPAERATAGKAGSGAVSMRVRRDGAEVIIDIADDGRGLDIESIRRRAIEQGLIEEQQSITVDEAIDMILRPGFTTAARLTQAAGRGVGMDVVDNEIKKLGGSMRIETEPGRGTRFVIRLPFTLAITHALIVRVGDETFALPLPTVEGITRVRREQLLEILTLDEPVLRYGEVNYRVQHLGSLVGAAPSALPEDDSAVSLVLVRAGDHSAALLTDSLEGSREIVVKTLGAHLASVPGVSGATILGDGRVTIILDAPTLVRAGGEAVAQPASIEPATRQLAALVVDDSITMRRVTQRLLERRGMRVLTARDGLDAIEVLQENEVDIIVLDIEMPRMDGYQFASHVRNDAKLKDTPIIMVTSRSGEKHRAKAIEVGVNDYLSKPYQEARLIGAIESLLGTEL